MVTRDYSLDNFNRFLDYVIEKGLMKPETAKGRKRASNSILGILESDECTDLRQIDVDLVSHRFANLQGAGFKPASLKVYQSRLRSALSDFFRYIEDPIGFKSAASPRVTKGYEKGKTTNKNTSKTEGSHKSSGPVVEDADNTEAKAETHSSLVFPIPIRPGLIVKVSNIPDDLTQAEAEKLSAVIKALAMPNPE